MGRVPASAHPLKGLHVHVDVAGGLPGTERVAGGQKAM